MVTLVGIVTFVRVLATPEKIEGELPLPRAVTEYPPTVLGIAIFVWLPVYWVMVALLFETVYVQSPSVAAKV